MTGRDKFEIGDKVVMSLSYLTRSANRYGTVTGFGNSDNTVRVRKDGLTRNGTVPQSQTWSMDFWEVIASAVPDKPAAETKETNS